MSSIRKIKSNTYILTVFCTKKTFSTIFVFRLWKTPNQRASIEWLVWSCIKVIIIIMLIHLTIMIVLDSSKRLSIPMGKNGLSIIKLKSNMSLSMTLWMKSIGEKKENIHLYFSYIDKYTWRIWSLKKKMAKSPNSHNRKRTKCTFELLIIYKLIIKCKFKVCLLIYEFPMINSIFNCRYLYVNISCCSKFFYFFSKLRDSFK